jgi:hypothetical protein
MFIVGDPFLTLCRALRRAVAFSPYLLPEGRIKRSSDHVSRIGILPRGLVIFRLLSAPERPSEQRSDRSEKPSEKRKDLRGPPRAAERTKRAGENRGGISGPGVVAGDILPVHY